MKIAVATENGFVSSHFGHCKDFTIYEVENGKVTGKDVIANPGHQPGFLPVFLKEADVHLVITGGMGERAQAIFSENGIDTITGAQGKSDDVIASYNAGRLKSTSVYCKDHNHS